MKLVPPIIIAEGLDVALFRSQAEAERAVEARDAASGVLRAWDATGRELRLDIGDAVCIDLAPVHLSVPVDHQNLAKNLDDTLRDFLAAIGSSPPFSATLAELLALVVTRSGYAR